MHPSSLASTINIEFKHSESGGLKEGASVPEWMGPANSILDMPQTELEPKLRPAIDSVQHRQLPANAIATCNLIMYKFETY